MARAAAALRAAMAASTAALALAGCGTRLTGAALGLAEGRSAEGSWVARPASPSGRSGAPAATSIPASTAGAPATGTGIGPGTPASAPSAAGAAGGCNASANGGATDTGVSAKQIRIGNIASITGVAPGLTKSAQQATEAVAAYINSLGGICGRSVVVDAYDDGNTSSQDYADAVQACASDFALVGDASGFDDGSASAVSSCGIPTIAAEISTQAATDTADIFGANPGDLDYWPEGVASWLHATYPQAVSHAAMIYLNVPATEQQAQHEMRVYESEGFDYVYTATVSPTEPNYAPYVQAMEQAGVQYVTEYSDDNSAARLSLAMAQAGFRPQVVDWIAEMYSPAFLSETEGSAVGDLVELTSAAYEDTDANPGMALFESWMNRVAPGWTHDIFAEFAWSAGLAFYQAAQAAGTRLTRANLLQQLESMRAWDGDGVQPPDEDFGHKIGSPCFAYFKITPNGYARLYPAAAGSYDCAGGLYTF
jgi:ABC-type branched-subunit amino acid transport system substrate-binding protein